MEGKIEGGGGVGAEAFGGTFILRDCLDLPLSCTHVAQWSRGFAEKSVHKWSTCPAHTSDAMSPHLFFFLSFLLFSEADQSEVAGHARGRLSVSSSKPSARSFLVGSITTTSVPHPPFCFLHQLSWQVLDHESPHRSTSLSTWQELRIYGSIQRLSLHVLIVFFFSSLERCRQSRRNGRPGLPWGSLSETNCPPPPLWVPYVVVLCGWRLSKHPS